MDLFINKQKCEFCSGEELQWPLLVKSVKAYSTWYSQARAGVQQRRDPKP